MTRILIGALAAALVLAGGSGFAEDTKKAPAAATQPATPDAKGESAGGCMPGGGCCGSSACKEASKATGDAAMPTGCPCQRRKAAAESSAPAH